MVEKISTRYFVARGCITNEPGSHIQMCVKTVIHSEQGQGERYTVTRPDSDRPVWLLLVPYSCAVLHPVSHFPSLGLRSTTCTMRSQGKERTASGPALLGLFGSRIFLCFTQSPAFSLSASEQYPRGKPLPVWKLRSLTPGQDCIPQLPGPHKVGARCALRQTLRQTLP